MKTTTVANSRPYGSEDETRTRLVWFPMNHLPGAGPVLVASALQDEAISSGPLAQPRRLDRRVRDRDVADRRFDLVGPSALCGGRGDARRCPPQRVIATVGEGERITIASNLTEALNQLFDGEDFSDLLGPVAAMTPS